MTCRRRFRSRGQGDIRFNYALGGGATMDVLHGRVIGCGISCAGRACN